MVSQVKQIARRPGARFLVTGTVAMSFLVVYIATAAPPADSGKSLFAPKAKAPAKDTSVKTTPTPKKVSQVAKTPYVKSLEVTQQDGEDLESAYYRYLNKNRVDPKVFRAKVRRIQSNEENPQRFIEMVAILRSALRTGQVQPWMYEVLGLAMIAADMPKDEIERTFMSAADFATAPQQLVYLADYMGHMGYNKRALDLLHQASLQAPDHPDAYLRGLSLALNQNDSEAIKWSSLGILRQAWPQDKVTIYEKARREAQSLISQLRKDNKHDEANEFASQLRSAMERDIVIKARWNGEADIDLMVEEPTGGVCSYRQRRTSGGGVLVGDPNGNLERSAGDGYSEVYACPKAFAGTYRIMLRQIWGHVPAGKVTVEIYSHINSDHAVKYHKVIKLGEDGSLVTFELDEGRRAESSVDLQIANDVQNQIAVRGILAQQVDALASPNADYQQQIANGGQQPYVIGNRVVPNGRGAVGFQPEVIVLPVGATMSVNAVISADRRYVRITALPFFSQITAVTQYSIQSGVTGTDTDFVDISIDVMDMPDMDIPDVDLDADMDMPPP